MIKIKRILFYLLLVTWFTMNTMKIVIENYRHAFTLKKMMIFATQIFPDFFGFLFYSLVNIRERFQFCILSVIRIMNYTFHDLFHFILFYIFSRRNKKKKLKVIQGLQKALHPIVYGTIVESHNFILSLSSNIYRNSVQNLWKLLQLLSFPKSRWI